MMDGKSNTELLQLLAYYDELVAKQSEAIAQLSRKVTEQAMTIALLRNDKATEEDLKEYRGLVQDSIQSVTEEP